jgi:hypothetical protein
MLMVAAVAFTYGLDGRCGLHKVKTEQVLLYVQDNDCSLYFGLYRSGGLHLVRI